MKYVLSFLCTLLLLLSCSKSNPDNEVPDCIAAKINEFKTNLPCGKSRVEQYTFQGKAVYVFGNEECCCDYLSAVFDTDCKLLGNLGGIAGFYKINGEDFSKAIFVKVVWKM
jgi:hypothetical protein